jgi:hypothetical protein
MSGGQITAKTIDFRFDGFRAVDSEAVNDPGFTANMAVPAESMGLGFAKRPIGNPGFKKRVQYFL